MVKTDGLGMSDRVLKLIEERGISVVYRMRDSLLEYGKNQIEFIHDNAVSLHITDKTNMENVYTASELVSGLNLYNNKIYEQDKKYDADIALFEPILKETQWYKDQGEKRFTFFDGKYVNTTVQAMFEVFLKTGDWTYKNNMILAPKTATDWQKVCVRDFQPDIERLENISKNDWENLCGDIYNEMISSKDLE